MSTSGGAAGPVLSRRALNRALLARQLLLAPAAMTPLAAVEHLAGMQAQSPQSPYVGLWARLASFDPLELAALVVDRAVVRVALMRSTIHLVTAADCLTWRPLVQPALERAMRGNHGRHLVGLDLAEVTEEGRKLVEERPMTFAEVGAALAERWPGRDQLALSMHIRTQVPLVQVPPRGVWGRSGAARHTSVRVWLGRDAPASSSAEGDAMVLRYLAAFGPASVRDAQLWSGIAGLAPVFDRLRPDLEVFSDEVGRELFDLPGAPRPDPGTPAPVRFIPEYDNLLLSHADRTRVIAPERSAMVFVRGAVLVDGFATGAWRLRRAGKAAVLEVELFEPLSPADRSAVEAEAERLGAFAAPGAASLAVQYSGG